MVSSPLVSSLVEINARSLRLDDSHILLARCRHDRVLNDLAISDRAFDRRLMGRMQFKFGFPGSRPGREQHNFVSVRLYEHSLQSDHGHIAMTLIGKPVVVRSPHSGES